MSIRNQETGALEDRLDEIHRLETKLIQLKRQLLMSRSERDTTTGYEGEAAFLILRQDNHHFAISVDQVEEVVEMVSVVTPQKQRVGVAGLIDYHGRLIALLDLAELAGMGRSPLNPDSIIVICTMGKSLFAVMVQEATDVVYVDRARVKTSDEVMPGLLKELGIVQADGYNAAIVDLWSAVLSIQTELDTPEEADETRGGGQ
jgi:chemotaxis signal transduction protein